MCVCVYEALYNSRWQMEYRLAKHLLIVMLNFPFTGFSSQIVSLCLKNESFFFKWRRGRFFIL